ncbi:hypothetical protein EON81_00905 [bacterium]|nr:MAG: hypothetical protein EON81_00905 [bacterium]
MRPRFVLPFLGLGALASANAVMGYALEQYNPRAWTVYVILTIAFEAWAIGRWAGFSWPGAVAGSLVANFVTAGCCAGFCGVGHSTFVGSPINPNPLANMIVVFSGFALISAGVEAIAWRLFKRGKEVGDNPLVLRVFWAHLVWVPICIAILLVPARPYPSLEGYTQYARRSYVYALKSALESQIQEAGQVPDYGNTESFFRKVVRLDAPQNPDAWAAAYQPEFGRFATGQKRGNLLWEWNPRASGLKIDSKEMPKKIWLIRMRSPKGRGFGLVWKDGQVGSTGNPADLGYEAAPANAR